MHAAPTDRGKHATNHKPHKEQTAHGGVKTPPYNAVQTLCKPYPGGCRIVTYHIHFYNFASHVFVLRRKDLL